MKHGLVHKIERLNSFVACTDPTAEHAPTFLICRSCETVAETHTHIEADVLAQTASDVGFKVERTVIEAEGVSPKCQ